LRVGLSLAKIPRHLNVLLQYLYWSNMDARNCQQTCTDNISKVNRTGWLCCGKIYLFYKL